ncbi:oxidoreductase [Paenibacillus kribbensis]|uniref:oxidoreductase n=1 Tax=Paenibacillus kribbensis TaxID=172713 RepID=UPI00083861BD|nr:FAD-dependent oxidoreductase [Paenibacillus kribbensis]
MTLKYPDLFKPFNIGRCRIKNRVVMSPMHLTGRMNDNGTISDVAIDYYEERAKGGAGLIITGGNVPDVDLELSPITHTPFKHPDAFLSQTKKLADKVHAYDTKLFVQVGMGAGRVMFPDAMDPIMNNTPVAPSAIPNRWDPSIMCRETTSDEHKRIVASLIEAAVLVKRSGADGIDIAGIYGGYLTDQYATKVFNLRTDEYGFEQNGQIKMIVDTIKGIKYACGENFPISVRVTPKHYMKGIRQGALPGEVFKEVGRDIEETIALTKQIEAVGADAVLIGNGSYDSFYWLYPPMYQKDGLWLEDAQKIREAVHIPVICPGKITTPDLANEAIKSGMIDAVAIGRSMLADAEWANKAKAGRDDDIRPCIGCETGCIGRIFSGEPLTCAVNPALFYEKSDPVIPALEKKSIAIIGGGIAGMETARVAKMRGHHVDLFEKEDKLGGAIIAAAVPDFKDADRRLLEWYERSLKQLGVNVHFNSKMDMDKVRALHADEIVIAAGATPRIPPIKDLNRDEAVTAIDILLGKKEAGEKCVVIGGGQVGCELAVWLQQKGKQVTIVEMLGELMAGGVEQIPIPNRLMMIDMVTYNKVDVKLNSKVESVAGKYVTLQTPDGTETLEADTVIISAGFVSNDSLYNMINEELPVKVWNIGDSKMPTNIQYAVRDGYAIGKAI